MALIRWEPARELQSLQQEMNRLFGSVFENQGDEQAGGYVRRWIPPMDLVEEQGQFVLRADLPGLDEQDVNIELEERVLTISGERRSEQEHRAEGYRRFERATGKFSRSLTLPEGIDPEAIAATFHNGVLEVRIPKPEERKPRRVQIKPGGSSTVIEGRETGAQRGADADDAELAPRGAGAGSAEPAGHAA